MRTARFLFPGKGSFFSPAGLVLRAGIGILVFLLLQALGFRSSTGLLSGTPPGPGPSGFIEAAKLLAYLAGYLFAWVAAPILLIAACVLAVLERIFLPGAKREEGTVSKPGTPT